MTAETIAHRYRLFLLSLSALTLAGTLVELVLIGHTKEALQFAPFLLSAAGLAAAIAALLRPTRGVLLALRAVMGVCFLGGLFGALIHIQRNLAFELEIRPGIGVASVFLKALGGASPLMAPAMLSMAAILALAATYQHPALSQRQ
jgi:hypothetical protein